MDKAKASAVLRLAPSRRLATLVAFVHTLEASAQDDALKLLEMLLTAVFGEAQKEDRKTRLRSLKDLDALAITLVEACNPIVSQRRRTSNYGRLFLRLSRATR